MESSDQFMRKSFSLAVADGTDLIAVRKGSHSDWTQVEMTTNGESNGTITLRGEAMADGLRFLLEQLLKG